MLTIRDGFEDEQSSLLKGEKMLKTYRIIPLAFILFLFGFTLISVAPVFAWDKSMGMRHPDRPCMKVNSCGPDMRSPAEIASDPYDTGNPDASNSSTLLIKLGLTFKKVC